jgi:acetylglutamate kinase
MKKEIICIKCGGKAAEDQDALAALAAEATRVSALHPVVFIHGGGAAVSALSRALGIEPLFRDGIRLTSAEEMDVVDMVLGGRMNTALVRVFARAGARAVGLTGCDAATFTGLPISLDDSPGRKQTHTGRITACDPSLIHGLLDAGFLPILASTSMTTEGFPLNINADEAALAVASALGAAALLFLSDIPGILKKRGGPAGPARIGCRGGNRGRRDIGGMIPKVRSSREALAKGVGKVIIGRYDGTGDIGRLLDGSIGTAIVP